MTCAAVKCILILSFDILCGQNSPYNMQADHGDSPVYLLSLSVAVLVTTWVRW